jgi:hypothetical protein
VGKIKIEVFEKGTPSTTVTVPGWVVRSAATLLPRLAGESVREHIDIDQIMELSKDPNVNGVILEVEDHKSNQRVVISIVGEEAETRVLPAPG